MRDDGRGGGGENFHGDHGDPHPETTSRRLADLARGRAGIVRHRDAVDAGVGRGALQWRLDTSALFRIHDGIYAVGHDDLSDEAWMHAAVLAGGERSAISHWTSLRRWGLLDGIALHPVHITVPREESYIRRHGIQPHRPMDLRPLDVTTEEGLPTTTVPRALLEMAPVLSQKRLALALHRAQVEQRMPLRALRAAIDRAPRARGRRKLHVLAFGAGLAPNRRERRFESLVRGAGLPLPQTNVLIETPHGTFLVDCLWREQRLVYEIDDPSHATPLRMVGDRRRDGVLEDAGHRVRRVTDLDLWGPGVEPMLRTLARRLNVPLR